MADVSSRLRDVFPRPTFLVTDAGKIVHTADVGITTTEPVLVIHTEASIHGVWRTANRMTAGTTTIITPDSGGATILTDILISTTKTAMTDLILEFTDSVETERIFKIDTSNNPHVIAVNLAGRIEGWTDAKLNMVTTGDVDATVTIGYFKIPTGLSFAAWDALR